MKQPIPTLAELHALRVAHFRGTPRKKKAKLKMRLRIYRPHLDGKKRLDDTGNQ